jgi:quinol monooxygenase YgiN
MLIIAATMAVRPDKHQELVQTVRALLGHVRQERGCVSSRFYLDVESENVFCLLEEWETQEDANNHLCSQSFSVLLGAMQLLSESPEMKCYVVSYTAGMEAIQAVRKERRE